MNTMKWLVKREFWEHRGGFFWAPAIVGALMVLGVTITSIVLMALGSKHGIMIDGEQVTNLSNVISAERKTHLIDVMANSYVVFAMPLFLIMVFAVFFFCLGSLFDERKDKSVLFWKSLPISDENTVLSKLAVALIGAPVLTVAIGVISSVLILLVVCILAAVAGINLFGVLGQSATYVAPLEIAAIIPVYMLWALPTVGWLMMVSAWARTKPFLWAVGVPVLAGTLLSWFNAMFSFNMNIGWFWQHIVGRGLLSVVPGSWFGFTNAGQGLHSGNHDGMDFGSLLTQSWQVFGTANLWIGVAVGAAMIYTAMRLRRWKDEG